MRFFMIAIATMFIQSQSHAMSSIRWDGSTRPKIFQTKEDKPNVMIPLIAFGVGIWAIVRVSKNNNSGTGNEGYDEWLKKNHK